MEMLSKFDVPRDECLLQFDPLVVDSGQTFSDSNIQSPVSSNDEESEEFHSSTSLHSCFSKVLGRKSEAETLTKPNDQKDSAYCPSFHHVLDKMFPPFRVTTSEGSRCHYAVSRIPASRPYVIWLTETLARLLLQRHARSRPLCPVREHLFSELFDEIIRQVTVECPERGLLLMRIRNEQQMTLDAYVGIYESAIQRFSCRRDSTLDSQKRVVEMTQRKSRLELRMDGWKRRIATLSGVTRMHKNRASQIQADEIQSLNQKLNHLEHIFREVSESRTTMIPWSFIIQY